MNEVSREDNLDRKILYVGADDSNNHDTRRARILAATFSFDHKDSIYNSFSKDRDKEELCYWLSEQYKDRNFRFALLTETCFNSMQPIISLAVPKLVLDYAPTLKEIPKKIWIEKYVKARFDWLNTNSNPLLRLTTYRSQCFINQINLNNWNLSKPVNANGINVN